MKTYIVLYCIESIMTPGDPPFGFQCWAKDTDHAEEQCINTYPDCGIVWAWEGDSFNDALDNYWAISDFERAQ